MAPAKERMEKYRLKAKQDIEKWKEIKEKDKNRKREERNKAKSHGLSKEAINSRREQTKQRMRKLRQKRKEASGDNENATVNSDPFIGSYKSKNSLNKATNKVKKILPSSPRKEKAVLAKLVQERFGKNLFEIKKQGNKASLRQISDVLKEKVVSFYSRDDVSWQAPGKRDVISIKDERTAKRQLFQKRYLLMNIGELKKLFDKENDSNDLSLASFYRLRPKHII